MPRRKSQAEHNPAAREAFALLAALARREFTGECGAEIEARVCRGPDWRAVLAAARRHGVVSLLCKNLCSGRAADVPQDILADLQEEFRTNAKRSLRLLQEVIGLSRLFQANDIPMMSFKGPLLGVLAYRSPSLRASADLDILVHEKDFARVRNLLARRGYQPFPERYCTPEAALLRYANACPFLGAQSGIELDVHWRTFPPAFSHTFDDECAWRHVEPVRQGGVPVPTMAAEEMLFYLCAHGSKHMWERFGWICDIAGLIRSRPQLDWSRCLGSARSQGSRRMLLLGLALAQSLAGTELPCEVQQAFEADAVVGGLSRQIREGLETDSIWQAGMRERAAFQFRLAHSPAERLRHLFRGLMHPGLADFKALPWPRLPFPVYYLIRPARLLLSRGDEPRSHVLDRARNSGRLPPTHQRGRVSVGSETAPGACFAGH